MGRAKWVVINLKAVDVYNSNNDLTHAVITPSKDKHTVQKTYGKILV